MVVESGFQGIDNYGCFKIWLLCGCLLKDSDGANSLFEDSMVWLVFRQSCSSWIKDLGHNGWVAGHVGEGATMDGGDSET